MQTIEHAILSEEEWADLVKVLGSCRLFWILDALKEENNKPLKISSLCYTRERLNIKEVKSRISYLAEKIKKKFPKFRLEIVSYRYRKAATHLQEFALVRA